MPYPTKAVYVASIALPAPLSFDCSQRGQLFLETEFDLQKNYFTKKKSYVIFKGGGGSINMLTSDDKTCLRKI